MARWPGVSLWVLGWAIAVGALAWQAFAVGKVIAQYERFTRHNLQLEMGVVPTYPEQVPQLYLDPDAYMWVRHAREVTEGNTWRVRWTHFDNHPEGRAVHWSNGFIWYLVGLGKIWEVTIGLPPVQALEQASIWANPILYFIFITASGFLIWRHWGAVAAVIWMLLLTALPTTQRSFMAASPDHHGVSLMAASFLLLAVALGGGAGQRKDPRLGILMGSIAGAVGLWIAAFTGAAMLGLAGLAGLLVILLSRREEISADTVSWWRTWSGWGAGMSLGFYLLEYFPHHLGWRLEVNHPLYALAWLGGGELLALLAKGRMTGKWLSPMLLVRCVLATLGVLALPITIMVGREAVYLPFSQEVWRMHDFIMEFKPLVWKEWWKHVIALLSSTLVLLLGVLIVRLRLGAILRRKDRSALKMTAVGLVAAIALLLPVYWQTRWMGPVLIVGMVAIVPIIGWLVRQGGSIAQVTLGLAVLTAGAFDVHQSRHFGKMAGVFAEFQGFPFFGARHLILHDMGQAIAQTTEGPPVIMGSPWPSMVTAFAAEGHCLGSLYWENEPGVTAAMNIWTATSFEEAAPLFLRHGVTHIIFVQGSVFVDQFYQMRFREVDDAPRIEATVGYQLLRYKPRPDWIQKARYVNPVTNLRPVHAVIYVIDRERLAEVVAWLED